MSKPVPALEMLRSSREGDSVHDPILPPAVNEDVPPHASLEGAVRLPRPEKHCANCDAKLAGSYCHECGQKHRVERLTVRRFLQDLGRRVFDLKSELLYTTWRLTVAPGSVSREYVHGKRRRYIGPTTYLIVVATLSILIFTFVEDVFARFLQEEWAKSLEGLPTDSPMARIDMEAFAATYTHWLNQGTLYFSLFMAGMSAVLVRWVVPGWKRRYNVAETCVFAVYTTAHGFLLSIPLYALFLFGGDPATQISILTLLMVFVLTGYVAIAARKFLDRRWTTVVMTWLAVLVSYLLFSVLSGVVGFFLAMVVAQ